MDKKKLRLILNTKRQKLSQEQQQKAAQRCMLKLGEHPTWKHSIHIGLYMAKPPELSLNALIYSQYSEGKQFYLPRMDSLQQGKMTFHPWNPKEDLKTNRYGIQEPTQIGPHTPIERLDVIIVPCLGVSKGGKRIGTGGGYYDRYLVQHNTHQTHTTPIVLGVAYDIQEYADIPLDPWDQNCNEVLFISTRP